MTRIQVTRRELTPEDRQALAQLASAQTAQARFVRTTAPPRGPGPGRRAAHGRHRDPARP